jgi:predicted dehydrogenase
MNKKVSRRRFIKTGAAGLAAAAFPMIVPNSVFGKNSPSNRITMGAIGVGRMGRGDLRELLGFDDVQFIAVCDADKNRMNNAKTMVDDHYGNKDCVVYGDYRDLLARSDIDAVTVVTPDFWHAIIAADAARAGKDIFLQKPMTRTIHEGRILTDLVKQYGIVLQVGSQQRSADNFRFACELARNEKIGKLHTVRVGLPIDPAGKIEQPEAAPENLNYDLWVGPAIYKPYIEKRVHPKTGYSRPGWMRVTDFTAGMITNWGAHHLDIARWGMGRGPELSGPIEIKGTAAYPHDGVWDVPGKFHVEYQYANGVKMYVTDQDENRQGIKFEGTDGWVFVRRNFIQTYPESLMTTTFSPTDVRLYKNNNHKGNFIECIKTRSEPVAPVENGHYSNITCLIGEIAMATNRKLRWDFKTEQFIGDEKANRMVTRSYREPWTI